MTDSKFFCMNCLMEFATKEEAEDHWRHTCKYGGYLAPINEIIRPIKELPKRREQIKKGKERNKKREERKKAKQNRGIA